MDPDDAPVLVAFDGSDAARAAVTAAARLFPSRRLVVVCVWEPGLAMAMATSRDPTGIGYVQPGAEEMAAIDRAQRDHAIEVAEAGVELARRLGATAEAYPVGDEADIAGTVATIADDCDAGAIVVGTRGLGGVKSRLFGSTSRSLLQRTGRPVLVVKAPE